MPPSKQKKPIKTRLKKWIKISAILAICGVTLLALLNGPIACWLVKKVINEALNEQGLSGDTQVDGTLLHGFTLTQADYHGKLGIRSLHFDKARVDYKLRDLLDSKVNFIELDKASLIIDIAKFPTKKTDAENSQKKIIKTLALIRHWCAHPKITVTDLNVSVLKNDQHLAGFSLGKLYHPQNSQVFELSAFIATDINHRITPSQEVSLVWSPSAIRLDSLELLPDLSLGRIEIDWSDQIQASAKLHLLEATLELALNNSLTATLTNGTLNSHAIADRFDLKLPAQASLHSLDLTLINWQAPPPQWDIKAQLGVTTASYDGYLLTDSKIDLSQHKHHYQLDVQGSLNETPLNTSISGQWDAPESPKWWTSTSSQWSIKSPDINTFHKRYFTPPDSIKLQSTAVDASGSVCIIMGDIKLANINADLTGIVLVETPMPPITVNAKLDEHGQIDAELRSSGTKFSGAYNLTTKRYTADLIAKEENTDWINALAAALQVDLEIDAPLSLNWTAQGSSDLSLEQLGTFAIEPVNITFAEIPTTRVATAFEYQWPHSISVANLHLQHSDWQASTQAQWNGSNVSVTDLKLIKEEQIIAQASGYLPLTKKITSLPAFLSQTEPAELKLTFPLQSLEQLDQWFGIPAFERLDGNAGGQILLTGSPSRPDTTGQIIFNNLIDSDKPGLPPLTLATNFNTQKEYLNLNSQLTDKLNSRYADFQFSFPFTPIKWLDDPRPLMDQLMVEPTQAALEVHTLSLAHFSHYLPQFETLTGSLKAKATLGGNLSQPDLNIDCAVVIPKISADNPFLGDIRNIDLKLNMNHDWQATSQLSATVNGGKFESSGNIDFTIPHDPKFSFELKTDYAMAYRDDQLSVRTHADIVLAGSLADATISGKLGLVESLFYKDIELIPIGIPKSAVAKVELPTVKADRSSLPIPPPFDKWKLDLTFETKDPLLLRGNVARGAINGKLKATGTLADPALDGKVFANDLTARLPFSVLYIRRGIIKFSPENGYIPELDLKGDSRVGPHDVQLFVHGLANSPKANFSSYPPLPENEIVTLLATGTTTSGLGNTNVAAFKTFQVFLKTLQRNNNHAGGNQLFKKVLSSVDELDLKIAEPDKFTGREYSSASVKFSTRWHFSAQLDDLQQPRGLIIYVIRFR